MPANKRVGDVGARELMLHFRSVTPAALETARSKLIERDSGATIGSHAITVANLARLSLDDHMQGICIRAVSSPSLTGVSETIDITLTRLGEMTITVIEPGSPSKWFIRQVHRMISR